MRDRLRPRWYEVLGLVLIGLTLFTGCTSARLNAKGAEADPSSRLPWNPYAAAHVGDFRVFRDEVKTNRSTDLVAVFSQTIAAADSETVAIAVSDRGSTNGPDRAYRPATRSCREPPTYQELVDEVRHLRSPGARWVADTGPISDVRVREEQRTLGDRTFPVLVIFCREQVTSRSFHEHEIWISREAPCTGLIEMRTVYDTRIYGVWTATWTLTGYGTKDGLSWGRSFADESARFRAK